MAAPTISLPIVIGGALLDSINPCVIGVLILLMTVLLRQKDKKKLLYYGAIYTAGVYLTYLVGGLTLLSIFNSVRSIQFLSQVLYVFIGMFVMIAGFLEVKDFFWYGKGFSLSIPKRFVGYIEGKVNSVHLGVIPAFLFGVAVTLVELPCTGAPYLAVLTLMTHIDFNLALSYLLLYNLVFVAPLIAIIYLAYTGYGMKKLEGWRQENRGKMRLFIGLFMLALSVWIITTIMDVLVPLTLFIVAVLLAMFAVWKFRS